MASAAPHEQAEPLLTSEAPSSPSHVGLPGDASEVPRSGDHRFPAERYPYRSAYRRAGPLSRLGFFWLSPIVSTTELVRSPATTPELFGTAEDTARLTDRFCKQLRRCCQEIDPDKVHEIDCVLITVLLRCFRADLLYCALLENLTHLLFLANLAFLGELVSVQSKIADAKFNEREIDIWGEEIDMGQMIALGVVLSLAGMLTGIWSTYSNENVVFRMQAAVQGSLLLHSVYTFQRPMGGGTRGEEKSSRRAASAAGDVEMGDPVGGDAAAASDTDHAAEEDSVPAPTFFQSMVLEPPSKTGQDDFLRTVVSQLLHKEEQDRLDTVHQQRAEEEHKLHEEDNFLRASDVEPKDGANVVNVIEYDVNRVCYNVAYFTYGIFVLPIKLIASFAMLFFVLPGFYEAAAERDDYETLKIAIPVLILLPFLLFVLVNIMVVTVAAAYSVVLWFMFDVNAALLAEACRNIYGLKMLSWDVGYVRKKIVPARLFLLDLLYARDSWTLTSQFLLKFFPVFLLLAVLGSAVALGGRDAVEVAVRRVDGTNERDRTVDVSFDQDEHQFSAAKLVLLKGVIYALVSPFALIVKRVNDLVRFRPSYRRVRSLFDVSVYCERAGNDAGASLQVGGRGGARNVRFAEVVSSSGGENEGSSTSQVEESSPNSEAIGRACDPPVPPSAALERKFLRHASMCPLHLVEGGAAGGFRPVEGRRDSSSSEGSAALDAGSAGAGSAGSAAAFIGMPGVVLGSRAAPELTFIWPPSATSTSGSSSPEPELTLPRGFCIKTFDVCVLKGTAKTMCLQALVGELPGTANRRACPPKFFQNRALLVDPATIRDPSQIDVLFAPQQPFLLDGSVEENITFGLPFDTATYILSLACCQLDAEVARWGGMALVGNGANVSGGQRQRLQLCRCVYRVLYLHSLAGAGVRVRAATDNNRLFLLLLDDSFSALDDTTCGKVLRNLFALLARAKAAGAVVMSVSEAPAGQRGEGRSGVPWASGAMHGAAAAAGDEEDGGASPWGVRRRGAHQAQSSGGSATDSVGSEHIDRLLEPYVNRRFRVGEDGIVREEGVVLQADGRGAPAEVGSVEASSATSASRSESSSSASDDNRVVGASAQQRRVKRSTSQFNYVCPTPAHELVREFCARQTRRPAATGEAESTEEPSAFLPHRHQHMHVMHMHSARPQASLGGGSPRSSQGSAADGDGEEHVGIKEKPSPYTRYWYAVGPCKIILILLLLLVAVFCGEMSSLMLSYWGSTNRPTHPLHPLFTWAALNHGEKRELPSAAATKSKGGAKKSEGTDRSTKGGKGVASKTSGEKEANANEDTREKTPTSKDEPGEVATGEAKTKGARDGSALKGTKSEDTKNAPAKKSAGTNLAAGDDAGEDHDLPATPPKKSTGGSDKTVTAPSSSRVLLEKPSLLDRAKDIVSSIKKSLKGTTSTSSDAAAEFAFVLTAEDFYQMLATFGLTQSLAFGCIIFLQLVGGVSAMRILSVSLFESVFLRHPLEFWDSHSTGDIMSRCSNDVGVVDDNILSDIVPLLTTSLVLLGSLILFAITFSPWVLLVFLVLLLILDALLSTPVRRIKRSARKAELKALAQIYQCYSHCSRGGIVLRAAAKGSVVFCRVVSSIQTFACISAHNAVKRVCVVR